jgi:hypothetical protein
MTTKAVKKTRVLQLVDLLGLYPQHKAVQMAAEDWGVTGRHVHAAYMNPAREAIAAEVGQTRTSLIKQTHRRLNAIFNRADDLKVKLEAVRQLAGLYGLNAPSQVAVTVDVLYNPEEQLRVLSDPVMLEKVLALDAEFEQMRLGHANGDGNPRKLPDGADAHPGPSGPSGDPGL